MDYYQNDICGANFTALRINSHSGVDTMDIAGNNVTLKDSWLHDTTHFAYGPEHKATAPTTTASRSPSAATSTSPTT